MANNEQIDKLSKKYVCISRAYIKFVKREHKRKMRRQRKNINLQNPQHNRYSGYIG